jgi:hypothetical protein
LLRSVVADDGRRRPSWRDGAKPVSCLSSGGSLSASSLGVSQVRDGVDEGHELLHEVQELGGIASVRVSRSGEQARHGTQAVTGCGSLRCSSVVFLAGAFERHGGAGEGTAAASLDRVRDREQAVADCRRRIGGGARVRRREAADVGCPGLHDPDGSFPGPWVR